jgi:hypothetical protein
VFGRRRARTADPREAYQQRRLAVLALRSADVGWEPSVRLPDVYGAVVETGLPWGSATLVALADGTAAHFTSTGRHPLEGSTADLDVVAAVRGLLAVMQSRLGELDVDEDLEPPPAGHVRLRALTSGGVRVGAAREEPLADGVDELSPLFFAAQELERQLRLAAGAVTPPVARGPGA